MIRIEENKLIIELDTYSPADDLQMLQKEIIAVIQFYNYSDFGGSNGCPFLLLLELLQATLPTYHQQKQVFEFTEMANDPAISQTAIVERFASRKEYLLHENENR